MVLAGIFPAIRNSWNPRYLMAKARRLLSLFELKKIKRLSNKGVAGAGRPPSLLVVAASIARSL